MVGVEPRGVEPRDSREPQGIPPPPPERRRESVYVSLKLGLLLQIRLSGNGNNARGESGLGSVGTGLGNCVGHGTMESLNPQAPNAHCVYVRQEVSFRGGEKGGIIGGLRKRAWGKP